MNSQVYVDEGHDDMGEGVLKDRSYRTRIRVVEPLNKRVWLSNGLALIRPSLSAHSDRRERLRACIRTDDGHFKQTI